MLNIKIINKKTGITETIELPNINFESTGYEYGEALADALENYIEAHSAAIVEVCDELGKLIHKLSIVPKGGAVMVTESGGVPLRYQFKQNSEPLPEKYLIMVNPERNNNKFYRMVDLGNHVWGAFYGRIGEQQGESVYSSHVSKPHQYPDYMYFIKLKEKLIKGYKDKTVCHKKNTIKSIKPAEFAGIENAKIADLIDRLMSYAKQTIKQHYTVVSQDVTPEMIQEAKAELEAMRIADSLNKFNNHLLELLHIIPRRIDGHKNYGVAAVMAKKVSDFADIILREQELLDIMEGQVNVDEKRKENQTENKDILDALGIEIYPATSQQEEEVKKRLSEQLKPKLVGIYRVINRRSQKAFDQYLSSQNEKVVIKQFWHGSRNANWISILQNGLQLNPDAKITGKMFGNGIYFAPSSMKSWGYTSSRDARWTDEDSSSVFMALYATAYGNSYEVYSHDRSWGGYNNQRLEKEHPGCNCVHAKADKGMLYNDEVIFYREDQMTINYLCEFVA